MPVELDTSGLEAEFEAMGREQALEAANRAFSTSQESLISQGDDHGYQVYPIAQSGQPPQWDERRNAAVFRYLHHAALFFEVGTQTHPIVADGDTLAFEWPEAPPKVREMYEETFPTVFMPKTNVDGIERLGFVDDGLDEAARWWRDQ